MNKKLFAIVLAFCAIILVGCGSVTPNLSVVGISSSASEFFALAKDETALLGNFGRMYVSASDMADYSIMYGLVFSEMQISYNMVSAIDFCMDIEEAESSVGLDQKVYEYETAYSKYGLSGKVLVWVGKVAGKSNEFACKQYNVASDVDFYEVEEMELAPNATNSFTITKDRATGKYNFTDSGKGVQGAFLFDSTLGHMSINISYVADVFGTKNFQTQIDFYNYLNGCIGARVLTKTTVDNQKVSYLFESFSKTFEKRAKMTEVKDDSLYYDLSAIKEETIATVNSGDKYGYAISYLDISDTKEFTVDVQKQGLES